MTEQTDERTHPTIVTDLMDLQARLRGEPASLVRPRTARPGEDGAVAALERSGAIASEPAHSRIEALRRRLASLELEIEAYEEAVATMATLPRPEGVVLPFRRRGDDPSLH